MDPTMWRHVRACLDGEVMRTFYTRSPFYSIACKLLFRRVGLRCLESRNDLCFTDLTIDCQYDVKRLARESSAGKISVLELDQLLQLVQEVICKGQNGFGASQLHNHAQRDFRAFSHLGAEAIKSNPAGFGCLQSLVIAQLVSPRNQSWLCGIGQPRTK